MSYQTEVDRYRLHELAIGTAAGQGPFIRLGSVTKIDAGQRLAAVSATPSSIFQNDVFPYKGKDILRVNLAAKRPTAAGAGDNAFLGIIGNNAAIASLTQAIGFELAGNDNIWASTYRAGSTVVRENTGINLGTAWKEMQIDLYTGVYSQSGPAVSKGGIGNVLFSVANDQGLLRPVGMATQFDMSAFADSGFQIGLKAEAGTAFNVDIKFVSVEYRSLPAA